MFGEQSYSAAEVAKICRLPVSTIRTWARTGLAHPSIREPYRGGWRRRYTSFDTRMIGVINLLRRRGESLQFLRTIAHEIRRVLAELPIDNAWTIVVKKDGASPVADGDGLRQVLREPGHVVAVIDVDDLHARFGDGAA